MTMQMIAAGLTLALMLKFQPVAPGSPLYRPRSFPAFTRGAQPDWSPVADYGDTTAPPPPVDVVRALDGIEDRLHADLEWLEAMVMEWLDRDPVTEHAHHVLLSDTNIDPRLIAEVLA